MQYNSEKTSKIQIKNWIRNFVMIARSPFLLFIITFTLSEIIKYSVNYFFPGFFLELSAISSTIIHIVFILSIYWLFLRALTFSRIQIQNYLKATEGKTSFLLLDFLINAINIVILLSLISFIIDLLPLPQQYNYFTEKLIGILIIIAISSILIKIVKVSETIVLSKYKIDLSDELLAHKARTQIIVLGRIAITMIIIISLGSMLLLFETVKNFGASILTSAGIISLISALAIQRPLRNLADSLQIIFNRLIKINDTVLIENEFGTIEEINLYYVVIRIWDLRSLIVPINYFVDKPFINLSRTSKEILCTVKLYVDYTLPLIEIRKELDNIVKNSPYWNQKLTKLEVTDAKEFTMELRILMSAKTSPDAWNLQCEVREKLIEYISHHYSSYLPKLRTTTI